MNEPSMEVIRQRLSHLERENRRFKYGGVLLLIVIAALIMMGQAKPSKVAKVIEAERFVLKDDEGKVRATLGFDKSEFSHKMGFTLYSESGERRMWQGVRDKRQWVGQIFYDQKGKHRSAFFIAKSGVSWDLYDEDQKINMTLANLKNRPSLIFFRRGEGEAHTGIGLYDNYKLRAAFMLDPKGNPELKFLDNDKKVIWSPQQNGPPVEDVRP